MKLSFKQQVVVFGVVVREVITEYTVGERHGNLIFADKGNGYGAWKRVTK
jgi:hypothetical protein